MKKLFGILFAFLVILSLTTALPSSDSRAITFDDFIQIKRLSDPQISPQGDKIAFVITAMDKETNTSNTSGANQKKR